MNGEEYLIVHHKKLYDEIIDVIRKVNAYRFRTKISKEKGRREGKALWNPIAINAEFKRLFAKRGWHESRRDFCVSFDWNIVKVLEPMKFEEQGKYLDSIGKPKLYSYNQTDFLKDRVAVEVQMGKYFAVTYDLFVKHLSFYTGGLINVGVEIVPMKSMQKDMSSGPPWFEKEVHNILRHGRTTPPIPLVIIGIAP